VEQRGVAGLLRVYLLLVSFGPAMTSARKSASRTGLPGPRVPDPIGTAADAPHGSRPEQVYSRLRDLIVQALERSDWNQSAAARLLRIRRHILQYRMAKFGVVSPRGGNSTAR